jgi:steroid 5-alpha reductase family enzyme
MGIGAIKLLISGHLDKELPRYEFQKKRWSKAGKTNTALAMQIEAIMQGIANAAFLAFPAFIISSNPSEEISILEMIGIVIWLVSFIMESVADIQKLKYLRSMKKSGARNTVCNIGLWKYSRHPNYFAEWMVWNALVIASIPSWLKLYPNMPVIIFVLVGVGLLLTSRIMYVTLVIYTGAVPSEYYSVQKRPAYKDYQQTTNMFFPGPTKKN